MDTGGVQKLRKEIEERQSKLAAWDALDALQNRLTEEINKLYENVPGNASEQTQLERVMIVRNSRPGKNLSVPIECLDLGLKDWDMARAILSVLEAKREEIKAKKAQL